MRQTSLNCVYELAQKDERIVFIGSDLGAGTLNEFKENIPDRFFMEGIAEQHTIGMAAGMAKEGFIPYVNTISTFLTRRCFEQVAIDACLHNLPIRLIANGGGLVYAPLGPTHLAIEDMAIMRSLPNMTVISVADAEEMKRMMPQTVDIPGPVYIRLGKGYDPVVSDEKNGFEIGKAILMREPGDVLIVATGIMLQRALATADLLLAQGTQCGVLHMHTVKPIDEAALLSLVPKVKLLITMEEHVLMGGLGSAVLETLVDKLSSPLPKIKRFGLPDKFAEEYGSQNGLLDSYGLSSSDMAELIGVAMHE